MLTDPSDLHDREKLKHVVNILQIVGSSTLCNMFNTSGGTLLKLKARYFVKHSLVCKWFIVHWMKGIIYDPIITISISPQPHDFFLDRVKYWAFLDQGEKRAEGCLL